MTPARHPPAPSCRGPRGATTRRRSALPAAVALLAALALTGCGQPDAGAELFPLESGRRWTYDLKTEWENNIVEHESRVIRAQGRDDLDDGPAWRRHSESGVDYWLRRDDSGVYRVASKSELQAEPEPDPVRRYVLKQPLAVGTTWQAPTTTYLLQRRQEFPREIRHTHPAVPMNYVIEATDETLDSRAGRFEHCLKVRGQATLRLFADPVVGWKDMPLTTLEWYCPGVGLVRQERHEPAHSTFLTGGSMTLELIDYQ